jgi:type II secretory pathway pseudopilin PulG
VLIVLAIAGLIMLIIFLTVPTVQANTRNVGRKHFVELLATQMEDYKVNHNNKYPITEDEICDFLTNYAATKGNPATDSCNPIFADPGDCVRLTTRLYDLCFHPNYVSHDYVGPLDEISFALSHWCNTDPTKFGEDPSHPITNGNEWPFDELFSRYAIWTKLERTSSVFCIDTYPRDN